MTGGVVYGDYLLLGRLNAGGMAEVFLGKAFTSTDSGKLIAVKRMLPQFSEDDEFARMFQDEARIARRLNHPNICAVYDDGQHSGQLYIALEFVHGKDLKVVQHRVRQRGEAIPFRIVAFVLAKVAEALNYAHGLASARGEHEGLVHRDVSPQNILLSYDGVPKLIDFGIAKAKNRAAETRVGVVKGKFGYMSPEQATGLELDGRSDIFSLGIVLYELLCGRPPFKGTSDLSTLKRIARTEYTPAQVLNVDVPKRLAEVVDRALAHDPKDRYQRAGDMAHDLMRYLRETSQEVDESVLSAYMRKLFRDDYVREVQRIKVFKGAALPANARRATSRDEEVTSVSQAQILAAGYGAEASEPAGPAPSAPIRRAESDEHMFDFELIPVEEGGGEDQAADAHGLPAQNDLFDVQTTVALPEELEAALRAHEEPAPRTPNRVGHQTIQETLEEASSPGFGLDVTPPSGLNSGPGAGQATDNHSRPHTEPQFDELSSPNLNKDSTTDINAAIDGLAMANEPSTLPGDEPLGMSSSRGVFTRGERRWLMIAALSGLAVVAASYWYASNAPLPELGELTQRTQ